MFSFNWYYFYVCCSNVCFLDVIVCNAGHNESFHFTIIQTEAVSLKRWREGRERASELMLIATIRTHAGVHSIRRMSDWARNQFRTNQSLWGRWRRMYVVFTVRKGHGNTANCGYSAPTWSHPGMEALKIGATFAIIWSSYVFDRSCFPYNADNPGKLKQRQTLPNLIFPKRL